MLINLNQPVLFLDGTPTINNGAPLLMRQIMWEPLATINSQRVTFKDATALAKKILTCTEDELDLEISEIATIQALIAESQYVPFVKDFATRFLEGKV